MREARLRESTLTEMFHAVLDIAARDVFKIPLELGSGQDIAQDVSAATVLSIRAIPELFTASVISLRSLRQGL